MEYELIAADRKGFTLIELIVVIVIIGILAAVAVPIMNNNLIRAKRTEAITGLGMIRTAERIVKSTTGSYETFFGGVLGPRMQNYMKRSDMDGTYYKNNVYYLMSNDNNATIYAFGVSTGLFCSMNINNGYVYQ